jgi:hypothetical protein
MMCTKVERNQIFEAITRSALDPAECNYEEYGDGERVVHESGSDILIEISWVIPKGQSRKADYVLTRRVIDGKTFPVMHLASIKAAAPFVTEWADEARLISQMPDLWTENQRGRKLITDIQQTDSGNTPFTQDEQAQISAQLEAITNKVKEQFSLTSEQNRQVKEKLSEAAEASARMGRKDWLLLFGGAIFTLIVTGTVTPAVAGHIFTMVIDGLMHIFIGGEPPKPLK